MNKIIGDKGKRTKYDPSLADKVNKEVEAETFVDVPKIEPISNIEDICNGYKEFMRQEKRDMNLPTDITDKYNPTKEQISEFSKKLVNYTELDGFNIYTANYLTALMHSNKNKEFTIDLTKLNEQGIFLDCLGYHLKNKKLTINGNAGEDTGFKANNSEITVNGNVGNFVGIHSKNSKIIVKENAGSDVGFISKNSEIYIEGNFKSFSIKIEEGTKIYQGKNKELIYPK